MSGECTVEKCFAPGISCYNGEPDFKRCENYFGHGLSQVDGHVQSNPNNQGVFSWTGAPFGANDIANVVLKSRGTLIGLIGPHNAGKTTFLALLYSLLSNGSEFPSRKFAGSKTWGGWEAIAKSMRLPPGGQASFPPHTPRTDKRVPGVLHLAFRKNNTHNEELLFTDAPGEWFREWALQPGEDASKGARWIMEHADVFILLIDREALKGKSLGIARRQIKNIIHRLKEVSGDRNVAIVHSKSDIRISKDIELMLKELLQVEFPTSQTFRISIKGEEGQKEAFKVLQYLLDSEPQDKFMRKLPVLVPEDPFLAFRGKI